ncbi:MAG TPA: DUF748 domain-containing protein [Steroidobacteraceae bacterium]|nr:DUF748 domain-containing protein [Steroidobacteraceae bacterium]
MEFTGTTLFRAAATTAFRIAALTLPLVGLYALAGFWLAPRLLRSALMEDIPKSLDARPSVGAIHVNPFLFQVEIENFSLAGPGGEKLVSLERLFVDFELSSLWHRAYSFAAIEIDAPSVNVLIAPDGNLNLSALTPRQTAPKPPPVQKQQPLPRLRIGSFKVSRGVFSYEDRSRPTDFGARLEPINFELREFTTGIEGGRFTLTGASKLGERVEWRGHVSVQPIESDGELRIDGLKARTLWEYLADRLNFEIGSGELELFATYKMSLRDTLDLHADISKIAVNGLVVKPRGSDVDWVTVPSLQVSGTTVDLGAREAHTDSISITGIKLLTWLEPDRSLNLMKLAQTRSVAATSSTPAMTATPAAAAAVAGASSPWKFELRELALRDASISVEDRSTRPAPKVVLAPLSLTVTGASLDLSKPVKVALETHINETGAVSASGEITPQPLSASIAVKLDKLDLALAQPYLAQRTSMILVGGKLSADTQVHYGAGHPAIQVSGDVSVRGLHTIDNALRDDFINWDRLDLQGIDYQQGPDRLDIGLVAANKLYARVIVEPDTSLNVTRVLKGPGATVVAPAPPGGAPVVATAPAAATPAAPAGPAASAARTSRTAPASAAASSAPAMPLSIKKIVLHASRANFADLSIQPNFSTGIQALEGTVVGLSSKADARAKVDIKGQVDTFSPVSITGEVNPFSKELYTDLALSFRNMELSTFNPYSGKFAGYNITEGKLTTELHYKVEGRKLDAQHHINIQELEFGDKTDSKDAVSLPIKLAVALLKDRNGVIDLDFPVGGTLDDPQFKLGPAIRKVVLNILEKAVTAPFALLGSLFGGGPELQFIDFAPGAADLDAQGADKARTMVKALAERPQLKIDVPLAVVTELDRPALVQARFAAEVQEAQTAGGRKKSGAPPPSFDQLDPGTKLDVLVALYAKAVGGEPSYPDAVTDIKTKPELAAAKAEFLGKSVRGHIVIAESDLTALGQKRAAAIQQALLADSSIDPQRVFLVANDKAKGQDGKVRLEMSLK